MGRNLSPLLIGLAIASLGVTGLSAQASSIDGITLSQQVNALRKQGPEGLQTFLKLHASDLTPGTVPAAALRTALDELCQQRDCYASRLYWYTDLEQAKAVARTSGKPILSLRLLGQLDQDLSCANSRFFRVALYPNAEVAKFLRDRYILHWQSVRPVPKVTIDFGDGRKLERTITGNSIHYILDASGRPIEALPGLYGPQAFLRQLQRAEQTVREFSQKQPGEEQEAFLRRYHRDRLTAIQIQWATELSQLGIATPTQPGPSPATASPPPTAEAAGVVAFTKMITERPIIRSLQATASQNQQALAEITDQPTWTKLAQVHAADARLDSNSVALIQAKKGSSNPRAGATSLQSLVNNLEAAIALDTVRNEYLLHSQIHQWFAQDASIRDVEALNNRVYAQLFLTPNSDPWLGLFPSDSFTAIENDGVRQ